MKLKNHNTRNRSPRRGLMMTELIVAASLLISSLSLLVTLSFRTGKLWQDSRHYSLAVNELTNQLERLTTLEEDEIDGQLTELEPSAAIQAALPNPRLTGEKIVDEYGTRVMLAIEWDRPGNAKPLSLMAWLSPPTEEEEL
jgi:hypothetical protein